MSSWVKAASKEPALSPSAVSTVKVGSTGVGTSNTFTRKETPEEYRKRIAEKEKISLLKKIEREKKEKALKAAFGTAGNNIIMIS